MAKLKFNNKLKPSRPLNVDEAFIRWNSDPSNWFDFDKKPAQMDQGKSLEESMEATKPKQLFQKTRDGKVTSGSKELDTAYEMAFDLAKYGYGFKYFMTYDNIKQLGEEKAKQVWKELIANMEDR